MSAPGQQSAPPGWYPDPDGAPDMVRWWNGVSWSDVATPAGPGVSVQWSLPAGSPPSPAAPPGDPAGRSPTSGLRTTWIVVASIVAVVVLVVLGLVAGLVAGTSRESEDAAAVSVPPVPIAPTFPPGTVRIVDEASGISYPFLGDGWFEWNLDPQVETTQIAGQFFTTQEAVPQGGMFIAQCTSGPLIDGYGWAGAASLPATLATVADSVRTNYYPAPNERRVLRDEPRTVDGAPAHLFEFDLSWDVAGYDASGERAALLLIDVGRPAPALLYISIPNTHAELYGVIDRVVDAVEVL